MNEAQIIQEIAEEEAKKEKESIRVIDYGSFHELETKLLFTDWFDVFYSNGQHIPYKYTIKLLCVEGEEQLTLTQAQALLYLCLLKLEFILGYLFLKDSSGTSNIFGGMDKFKTIYTVIQGAQITPKQSDPTTEPYYIYKYNELVTAVKQRSKEQHVLLRVFKSVLNLGLQKIGSNGEMYSEWNETSIYKLYRFVTPHAGLNLYEVDNWDEKYPKVGLLDYALTFRVTSEEHFERLFPKVHFLKLEDTTILSYLLVKGNNISANIGLSNFFFMESIVFKGKKAYPVPTGTKEKVRAELARIKAL